MTNLEAEKFIRNHRCAVCGNFPSVFPGPDRENIVRCQDPEHTGFTRIPGYMETWRAGAPVPIFIANQIKRREKQHMEQEHGEEISTAIAPYMGVTSLTQEQAAFILRTVWPKAPDVEVIKAALICHQYALNPLMKHIYLVEYKKWRKLL